MGNNILLLDLSTVMNDPEQILEGDLDDLAINYGVKDKVRNIDFNFLTGAPGEFAGNVAGFFWPIFPNMDRFLGYKNSWSDSPSDLPAMSFSAHHSDNKNPDESEKKIIVSEIKDGKPVKMRLAQSRVRYSQHLMISVPMLILLAIVIIILWFYMDNPSGLTSFCMWAFAIGAIWDMIYILAFNTEAGSHWGNSWSPIKHPIDNADAWGRWFGDTVKNTLEVRQITWNPFTWSRMIPKPLSKPFVSEEIVAGLHISLKERLPFSPGGPAGNFVRRRAYPPPQYSG